MGGSNQSRTARPICSCSQFAFGLWQPCAFHVVGMEAAAEQDMQLVELTPSDAPLLRRLAESMRHVFGEDELDDVESLVDSLCERHEHCKILCIVALGPPRGGDPQQERPVIGGALWEYFTKAECFLYTYLFLDPAVSHGKGLGRDIANAMWAASKRRERQGWRIRAIFIEFHNPELVDDPGADAMDPVKRLEMFQHMGARQLGRPAFRFFQPPLHREDGQSLGNCEHCEFLMGVVVTSRTDRDSTTGEPFIPVDTVVAFFHAYYADCAGEDYVTDPYFQGMLDALASSGQDHVPLVEFDCLASRWSSKMPHGDGRSKL